MAVFGYIKKHLFAVRESARAFAANYIDVETRRKF